MKKHNLVLILLIALIIPFSSCTKKDKSIHRSSQEIIEELIQAAETNSPDRIDDLLHELHDISDVDWRQWDSIITFWQNANSDMEINTLTIPLYSDCGSNLCIIVLGYQLNSDGSMRSELIGRLEKALECATAYPDAYLLCTGGGTASNNHTVSEAGEMAKWLMEHGIASERLLVEDRSLSTIQNALFSYSLLCEQLPNVDSVLIVSSDYHIPWGTVLFETEFILAEDVQHIFVIGNAAFETDTELRNVSSYQANGVREIYYANKKRG